MAQIKCKVHKITLWQGDFQFQFDEIWCQLCQRYLNIETDVIVA